ncbi:hypothetical protein BJD10_15965 [Xanthomonas hortorum pv. gardneri]|nr:hypothetical protein BJD10_15965 [Xanthomonas hortorum pv. gardneri]
MLTNEFNLSFRSIRHAGNIERRNFTERNQRSASISRPRLIDQCENDVRRKSILTNESLREPLNNAPQIRDTTRLLLRSDPCN